MPTIIGPDAVVAAHLYHPLCLPDGRRLYQIETNRRYSSNQLPIIRDPHNAPVVLHEELGVGSLVRLAIGDDGMMRAVQIMQAAWADPFADVA
jgi:hypothetical protein